MTCSPGGYEVRSYSYFDNGFNIRWCPNKIYSDFPFDMTAQSNLFDFLDITDDMWYHDISYEADPNLQKYGCYVTNILSTRKLYIRPKQLEGMFTFSENRHELYIAVQQSWWSGPGAVTFKAMMLVFIFCRCGS